MSQSLYRPTEANIIEDYTRENHFFHTASNRHYRMIHRDSRFFQRRYQLDERGAEINTFEREVSYIMGSGKHARSYLHLSETGELTQLPVTWYSQERRWGMSPGYDRPNHFDFTRSIDYGCMFCHNSYASATAGADEFGHSAAYPRQLPEGIDCQRCHGPGARHVSLASLGKAKPEEIRSAIVNPKRLPVETQMDVCFQCHLETTSTRLPHAVRRFGRAVNSFRPGERLADYLVQFDHPAGTGHDDKFEIVSAGYRLRKSACFLASKGRLTCLTCHNPHDTRASYDQACASCHPKLSANVGHAQRAAGQEAGCVRCHMPKRRAEDAIHVVMTDHLIQRIPRKNLLAPLSEKDDSYRGGIALYYPPDLPETEKKLYLGQALIADGAAMESGVGILESAIAKSEPAAPIEVLVELGTAYMTEGNPARAAAWFAKALDRQPGLSRVRVSYGRALEDSGDRPSALAAYERAIREDGKLADAHNRLGLLLVSAGNRARAEVEFRAAIANSDTAAEPHINLGNLLAGTGQWKSAREEFERAFAVDPDSPAEVRFNLGKASEAMADPAAAIREYRRAILRKPSLAAAHLSLGALYGEAGRMNEAIAEFRETLKLEPGNTDAQNNLKLALEMRK